MNITKKITLATTVMAIAPFAFAQSLQDGIIAMDSHKYAKAKDIFTQLIAKAPTAENYFYLGNAYLTQNDPNFTIAADNFNKGIAADKKDFLNKIGLASIKLGKGDASGITDIQNIVKDSRERNPEVLYRAGEALTLFPKTGNADLAVDYINKAIEKSSKGVPAYYYYGLGDAYRMKISNSPQVAGAAMTAYDKALMVAQNKASVYTRMGTLWMAAQQWQQAKQSIDKAIAADPTYAPAYKAMAGLDLKYQQNASATQDLLNYAKYADDDPYTQLEIAKLFFINEDYANAKSTLDKIYDKVDDPIKYKLNAYLQYADGNYKEAKESMNKFITSADKSRVQPGDSGLLGLIDAGLAKTETDPAIKAQLLSESTAKIQIAKNAKDETMKWDEELAKIAGGGGASQAKADAGPSTPEIVDLKKQIAAAPEDTNLLFKLANAYQDAKNWDGAILTWQKMENLVPDWAPAYYSQGYAYQQAGNNEMAKLTYDKYISKVKPEEVAANKDSLAFAYYVVAFLEKDTNLAKAKQYILKSIELNPGNADATKLSKALGN